MINVEVKGVNRVANPIRRTVSQLPQIADRVMERWARRQRVRLKAIPYPPERPGQTYIRTGNLANRWAAKRIAVARWSLVNTADYALYVLGDERGNNQAWMHAGRWPTARANVEQGTPELVRMLTAEYKMELAPDRV